VISIQYKFTRTNRAKYSPYYLALLLLCLFSFPAFSQNYYFDNYNVQNGLAQSNIYSIIQDKDGYIWLGTAGGASRFDGLNFVNYTTDDSLADNGVKSMIQTEDGCIWLGHIGGGISRIDNGIASTFEFDSVQNNDDITAILQDKDGHLWISTYGNGAILIDNPEADSLKDLNVTFYRGQEGLSDRIFSMMITEEGVVYFVTDVGIKQYNKEKDEFDFFRVDGVPAYFQITSLLEDSKGNFWFGTYNGGLFKSVAGSKKVIMYDVKDGLADNWISCLAEDQHGNIWAGTWGGGLSKLRDGNGDILTFRPDNGLKDKKIRCLLEDREGNILIGTNENGLLIFKGEQFVSYSETNGLIDDQIWAVLEDSQGKFWFGTNEGITTYDPAKAEEAYENYTNLNGLVDNHIRFIKEDKNRNLWIASWGGGILKYNRIRESFEYFPGINNNIYNGLVTALEIDQHNNLWIGTLDGLIYYEIDRGGAVRLSQTDGLAGNDISALFCDAEGVMWIGSRGLGVTSITDTAFKILEVDKHFTPTAFIEDQEGKLWIGTEGQGLMVSDKSSILKSYKTKNGLLTDLITLLNIDDEDNIWVGTNKGLNKYVQEEDKFYRYTSKVGFSGIEVKNQATFKDSKGNLWFGTIKGAYKYQAEHARHNFLEPLTHITSFKVNLEPREMKDGMSLNYQEKEISFQFNSICLTDPTAIKYRYKLEGSDKNWRPANKQTFVNYSPLPPNDYVFMVEAMNNDGVWNEEPVTFSFKINPPFWQTWWFYLICAAIAFGLIYGYVKVRERNLLREKKVLEEKVEQRTRQVVEKSEELEQKNNDILDSIRYAKVIQTAILPPDKLFDKLLPESFVLFKPKDIVSGDFYWINTKGDKILFAAADCTGHGVPGAFVSMVGYNLMDKIVGEYDITEPAAILDRLNFEVAQTFRQKGETDSVTRVQDGMDIALVAYDRKKSTLEYAGAFNPLYLLRDGEIVEFKANRTPIGSFKAGEQQKFDNHIIKLKNGDRIYMFTDGFVDQFGGPKGKKFMAKRLREKLMTIGDKPMKEQGRILDETLYTWMGSLEQVDDILGVGARFEV
jgi:ligand-binding sensor domain-containing protein/serine phosphatase RsbU (regulator of sigma subunit)